MDWTSESISIWHFPRNKIPANIVSKQPDPSTWGAPQALFGSSSDPNSCDIGASFSNMSIVLDIVSRRPKYLRKDWVRDQVEADREQPGLLRRLRWWCAVGQQLVLLICIVLRNLGWQLSITIRELVLGSELYRCL